MRGGRRQIASKLQLMRQLPLHLSTTPATTLIRGHRPTQAKILSLGEYIFLTDITFMFTHSCQLSVLILFHCNILASLFPFPSFFLCVRKTLRKKKQLQLLASLLSMPVVVVIKIKPKKISRSSFACWELSRVNSFISFLSFGGREEKTMMKMLSGSHMHYC